MNKITKILMSTLMIFGLASSVSVINDVRHDYTTVEAATTIDAATGKITTDIFTADGAAEGWKLVTTVGGLGSETNSSYFGIYGGAYAINTTAMNIDSSKDVNVTINARKYGGPTSAQVTMTVQLLSADNTVLATKTVEPTTTENEGYTVNLKNTSGVNGTYIKVISASSSTSGKFAGIYSGKVEYYEPVAKTQLSAPTNVSYDDSTKVLSWTAVENASKYSIYLLDSQANEYTYESTTNSFDASDLAADTYSGTIKAVADPKSTYLDSNEVDIEFTKTSAGISASDLEQVQSKLSFGYSQLVNSSSITAEELKSVYTLSSRSGQYISSTDTNVKNQGINFGNATLTSDVERGIRVYNAEGTYEIRLYGDIDGKGSRSFKVISVSNITSIILEGTAFSEDTTGNVTCSSGYTYNKINTKKVEITGNGLKEVVVTLNKNATWKVSKITVVEEADASLPKYKDFNNVTLNLRTTLAPSSFVDVTSSGIIVSTSSTISSDFASSLPTNVSGNGERTIVAENTTLKADYTIALTFNDLAKCKDVIYVYSYATTGTNIYYSEARELSVYTVIDTYLALTGDQALSADTKELLTALKAAIDVATTPSA